MHQCCRNTCCSSPLAVVSLLFQATATPHQKTRTESKHKRGWVAHNTETGCMSPSSSRAFLLQGVAAQRGKRQKKQLRRNTRPQITDDCKAQGCFRTSPPCSEPVQQCERQVAQLSPNDDRAETFLVLPFHLASTEASPLVWSAAILRAPFLPSRRFHQCGRSSCLQTQPAL